MSTQAHRDRLREAGRQLSEKRKHERFAESLCERLPYVFGKLYRCPDCCSTALKSNRSVDQGDGSRKRWTKCKTCGAKFFLILD